MTIPKYDAPCQGQLLPLRVSCIGKRAQMLRLEAPGELEPRELPIYRFPI